jgi:hypothetical protein
MSKFGKKEERKKERKKGRVGKKEAAAPRKLLPSLQPQTFQSYHSQQENRDKSIPQLFFSLFPPSLFSPALPSLFPPSPSAFFSRRQRRPSGGRAINLSLNLQQ